MKLKLTLKQAIENVFCFVSNVFLICSRKNHFNFNFNEFEDEVEDEKMGGGGHLELKLVVQKQNTQTLSIFVLRTPKEMSTLLKSMFLLFKCSSYNSDLLLASAQYTVAYVKAVGQEASPSKCMFLSMSKATRKRMTAWRHEDAGCLWAAGTLSNSVKEATSQVIL